METRPADFAGSWYPGTESECLRSVKDFLAPPLPCPEDATEVIGGIVPHAGWVFSGRIACNVIRCLTSTTRDADTILIFGHHMQPRSPSLIMAEGQWDTPFGPLEIDQEVAHSLASEFPFTVETAYRYVQDNTIELQLPFIKHFAPKVRIVPMGLPPRDESLRVARRAAGLCRELGRKALVLGSTDLTHYGPNYGFMPQGAGNKAVEWVKNDNDRRVITQMLAMEAKGVIREALGSQNACCSGAAACAIEVSVAFGAKKAFEVAYSTSYDKRPDSSFVGYAGIVYYR